MEEMEVMTQMCPRPTHSNCIQNLEILLFRKGFILVPKSFASLFPSPLGIADFYGPISESYWTSMVEMVDILFYFWRTLSTHSYSGYDVFQKIQNILPINLKCTLLEFIWLW